MQPQIIISPDIIPQMKCEKAGHNSRQIQFVCKFIDCTDRFLCGQCILEHQQHFSFISLIDKIVEEIQEKSKCKTTQYEQNCLSIIKQFIDNDQFKPKLDQKLEQFENNLKEEIYSIKEKFEKSKETTQENLEKNKNLFLDKFKECIDGLSEAVNENKGQKSSSGNNKEDDYNDNAELTEIQLEEYLIQKAQNKEKQIIKQYNTSVLEQYYMLKYLSMKDYSFGQIINDNKVENVFEQWKNLFKLEFQKKAWEVFAFQQQFPFEQTKINFKELNCKNVIAHKKPINSIVFVNGNKQFAVASDNFSIQIYDTENLELVKTLKGHNQKINCLTAIQNSYLASGSQDSKIIIWNISTGNQELVLSEQGNNVQCMLVLLPAKELLSSGLDKIIKLWDINAPGKKIKQFPENNQFQQGKCFCMQIGSNELYLGSDHHINILDYPNFSFQQSLKGHTGTLKSLVLANNQLISGAEDKKIKVWDLGSKSCIHTIGIHTSAICKLISYQGIVISIGEDGKIGVVLSSNEYYCVEKAHEGPVFGVDCSGGVVVTGGKDGKIKVWQ